MRRGFFGKETQGIKMVIKMQHLIGFCEGVCTGEYASEECSSNQDLIGIPTRGVIFLRAGAWPNDVCWMSDQNLRPEKSK
jgi:hypothetical protein